MSPTITINLQPVYDQILQETFTDSDTNNGRTSPRSRSLHSPVYENLNRPPHVTLYWLQGLDGSLIPTTKTEDNEASALTGLTKKLEEAHQAMITCSDDSPVLCKRVLINPPQPSQADIIYTTSSIKNNQAGQVHVLQEQDGLLPQVFRHLVREHHVRTLLLKPNTTEALTMYVNSQQFDKIVLVLKAEMIGEQEDNSKVKRLPFKLVNTHYEFLDGFTIITGEPQYSSNSTLSS